ncbi:hypothetical protein [Paraliobacillus salinarum]|uniref:hypothetical protein n=1 Tax=Paraliobacillus salinarum TaxID=1158996 RepID=UPI0015F52E93|nr:hypothetical protein [Paraliobacillus salinarum]
MKKKLIKFIYIIIQVSLFLGAIYFYMKLMHISENYGLGTEQAAKSFNKSLRYDMLFSICIALFCINNLVSIIINRRKKKRQEQKE